MMPTSGFTKMVTQGVYAGHTREIPPRTIGQLGYNLIDGFKTFVAFVRLYERKQTERVQEARNLLQEGFAEIDHD